MKTMRLFVLIAGLGMILSAGFEVGEVSGGVEALNYGVKPPDGFVPRPRPTSGHTVSRAQATRSISMRSMYQVTVAGYRDILHYDDSSKLKIFRYIENQEIYIFNFPSLHEQAMALNRIAALIEKLDLPENRVIPLGEMNQYYESNHLNPDTFYFGHNYNSVDLAEFFTLAERGNISLNDQEKRFLAALRDLRIIEKRNNSNADQSAGASVAYKSVYPKVAVLTLSNLQDDNPDTEELDFVNMPMRCTILRHELSHGEFYTNSKYRKFTQKFWQKIMQNKDREAFRQFLKSKGYDGDDEFLMANEMQAYLMHSPNPRAFSAQSVGLSEQRINELRKMFLEQGDPVTDSWTLRTFYPREKISRKHRRDIECAF
jgi:predicted oxidoreductase (fatty acid repression mutant protein)